MKQIKLMKRGEGCRVCGHRGLIISSAFDGRPSYKCDRCGYYETRGIKPNQGKQWKRELDARWTQ